MKILKLVSLLLIAVLLISGCAGKGSTKGVKEIWYPEWWNEQEDLHYIHTYGVATRLLETMALDTAANNAIFEAAKYVLIYDIDYVIAGRVINHNKLEL